MQDFAATNAKKTRHSPHPVLSKYYKDEDARREKVDEMFNTSAEHYDWICDFMSFGSGDWYRKQALIRCGLESGMSHLDVGAGTGVVSSLGQDITGEQGLVVALDPSIGMLSEAVKRGVKHASMGLGEALPFPDDTFDRVTMGYALRHVADLEETFKEYRRVLKPGGKVLILEISKPRYRIATFFLKLYMKGVIPIVTRLFRRSANAQELMQYYWDTIEQCVPPTEIVDALKNVGFNTPKRDVLFGIFSEYTGVK